MDKKSKSLFIKTLGMIIAAVIPAAMFFYFRTNNDFNQNNMLPNRWWPIGVDSVKNEKGIWRIDTIFHVVPPFSYLNCDGKTITDKEMEGKISVVELFFVQCQSICPVMNGNMKTVYNSINNKTNLRIFSFTIDPERDTLSALRDCAAKYGANTNQWFFLWGNQDSTFKLGRKGFKIPVDNTDSETDFLHSDRFMLVDAQKHIRGYYLGTDSADIQRLKSDIVYLLDDLEHPKKNRRNKR